MNRPGFVEMMQQLEQGKASAVFVKDLSRLGRNYIEVGRLTEEFFPDHDIRLVAVSDNIDTAEGENELAPIRNLFNEWYARDISKKRRISNKIKGNSGEPMGLPPYGYIKDPNNPKHWVIDEEAAQVVRRIAVNELSGSVQDYQDFFKALEQSSPVPIGFEDIEGGAHGYFHLLDNRIAIQEGMSQLQTIKTAIHEIAHAKLHAIDPNDPEQSNRPDSRTREVQAESVAYAVCQHYGLDTSEYSFGYVAGWSSGRELAELKASLEVIRSAAHELIAALDEHLAELRQQREADLSAAQEVAFALDNGNTLFIQTCDSGYDYTLYDADKKALDGGQLDAPGLTLPDAGQEALNLLRQTAAVAEVLLGDKLAAFREAAEKANEIPAPVKIPDPAAEPTVTILWSESDKLQDGEIMPLSVANRVFEELDTAQHTDREKDGYTGGWYDKTAFRIDFTLNGQPDNYEGRQDFGDGEGSLVQHIQNYHEYYAKDENWKNFVLHGFLIALIKCLKMVCWKLYRTHQREKQIIAGY